MEHANTKKSVENMDDSMDYNLDIINEILEKENLSEYVPKLDNNMIKLYKRLRSLRNKLVEHKTQMTYIFNETKTIELLLSKCIVKNLKQIKNTNHKKNKKPSGFASPVKVSNDLCEFMGKEHGSLISRTDTSIFLSNYIKEHNLQSDTDKSIIIPDSKLAKLLGSYDKDAKITHFTIQKYINKHFYTK